MPFGFIKKTFKSVIGIRPNPERAVNFLRGLTKSVDVRNIGFFANLTDRDRNAPRPLDISGITTDDQARLALDSIMGTEPSQAQEQAEIVDFYRNRGGFERILKILTPAGGITALDSPQLGLPFTIDGDASLATKDFAFDPIFTNDLALDELLSNQDVFLQYMRITDPQQLLASYIERDQNRIGNNDESILRGILGNPLAAARDVFMGLITGKAPERMEIAFGMGYYQNAIPDPYLRYEFSKKSMDFLFQFWDPGRQEEAGALAAIEQITLAGLEGEAAVTQLDRYFEQNPLGWSGFFANLTGSVIVDPLNFIPPMWLVKPVTVPLKFLTGAPKLSRILRLFTPTGRKIAGVDAGPFSLKSYNNFRKLDGVRKMTRLSDEAYSAQKWAEPVRGVTRVLTEQPPNLFADDVRRVIEIRLARVSKELVSNPDRMKEIGKSLATGKPSTWVKENLTDLLDQEQMRNLGNRMSTESPKLFDDVAERWGRLLEEWDEADILKIDMSAADAAARRKTVKPGSITPENPKGEVFHTVTKADLEELIPSFISAEAKRFAGVTQTALWDSTAVGHAMNKYLFPFIGGIKTATAFVTINNPGFIWLNMVSNGVRLAWHSAFHPINGSKAFARSFLLEAGTVMKTGGGYPKIWTNQLASFGMTPLGVERNLARQVGISDILGKAAEDIDLLDDGIVNLSKAILQPAKEIGARSRWTDKFMFPVHIAARVDKLYRRATYFSELQTQIHLGLSPGGEIRGLFGPMRNELLAAGRTLDEVALAENSFADTLAPYLYGTKNPGAALDEKIIVDALNVRLDEISEGLPSGLISPHDLARRFVDEVQEHKTEMAGILGTKDLAPFVDFLTSDVMPILNAAQREGAEALGQALGHVDQIMAGYASEFDVPSTIARIAARLPTSSRGKSNYVKAQGVIADAFRRDMVDNVSYLDNLFGVVNPAWATKEPSVHGLARAWLEVAKNATTENISRYEQINGIYRSILKTGVERVNRNTRVPKHLIDALPDDLKIVTRKPPVAPPPGGAAPAGLSKEAADLLKKVDAPDGALPAFISKNLRKIADEHNIPVTGTTKPEHIVEALRKIGDEVTPPAGVAGDLTIGQVWDNYFKRRSASVDEMLDFADEAVRKLSVGDADMVVAFKESVRQAFKEHKEIIAEAMKEGGDAAWTRAGERVRLLYQEGSAKKAKIFGLSTGDIPSAQELMDPSAVLASTIHEFTEFVSKALRADLEKLRSGALRVEPRSVSAMRSAIPKVSQNWPNLRDTLLANAQAATDFVMLNYLDQRGIDRIAQAVFPFEFWPTRDAMNWAIRGARAPGAFGALTIAMFQTKEYGEQYGYPQRLDNRVPILIPGIGEWLEKLPGIGPMIASGNFSNLYFIDPIRFVFPYTFLRDGFDEESRRNTPLGRVLDFVSNFSPLNVGPFQKFAFRNAGLLDKDAWRATYLSGGPFGIPLTPIARETARWLYGGDTTAIPEEEQSLYVEKGHFSPKWLAELVGIEDDPFAVWRTERAIGSLIADNELIPGASKEEQVAKGWIAVDTHKGPEWEKAVKAAKSEVNLRRLTHWIGFPFGDVVGVNEGEMIWFGLKGLYGEASRKGELDKFFEKYPEFELRSATVRGLSDPKEREQAIDTELFFQGLDSYVERPFAKVVLELETERERLERVTQTQDIRDRLQIIRVELQSIKGEKEKRRETLDAAFPFRAKTVSLNKSPRERALNKIRGDWFDIERGDDSFEAYTFRREQFLEQFPTVEDVLEHEWQWQQVQIEFMSIRLNADSEREVAFENDDFSKAEQIAIARDEQLEELHTLSESLITRREVESYLATFAWPKTVAQMEFERADALKDLWFSLTSSGSPFTSREKGAMSDYFRSLPELQKFFPTEVMDLEEMSLDQRFALMRRKDFWSTFHSLRDGKTQLDYAFRMKPQLDEANRILGLPPLSLVDIEPYPAESSGDPMMDHIQMMAALHRREDLNEEDSDLSDEERTELEDLLATYGGLEDGNTSLTANEVARYAQQFSMEDLQAPEAVGATVP